MRPDDLASYYGRLNFAAVQVLGCFDGPELIGVLEVHPTAQRGTAEIALTVDEPWRGVGVGLGLVTLAIAAAQQRGFGRRVAYCQEENLPMRRLMASAGFAESIREEIVIGLHEGLVDAPWPPAAQLRVN
jgi:RimJ/RimL family protein N-acetyltransferase